MAYSDYGGYGFRNGKRVPERSDCTITPEGKVEVQEFSVTVYRSVDQDAHETSQDPAVFRVDGHVVEIRFVRSENHYVFARVEQPCGTFWIGWSGYGVGAGLEDCGYGYSTESQNRRMQCFWPDSIQG